MPNLRLIVHGYHKNFCTFSMKVVGQLTADIIGTCIRKCLKNCDLFYLLIVTVVFFIWNCRSLNSTSVDPIWQTFALISNHSLELDGSGEDSKSWLPISLLLIYTYWTMTHATRQGSWGSCFSPDRFRSFWLNIRKQHYEDAYPH